LTYTSLHRVPQDIDPDASTQDVQMGGESAKVNKPPTPGIEKTVQVSSKPRAQVAREAPPILVVLHILL
jgi:hypothetical protein